MALHAKTWQLVGYGRNRNRSYEPPGTCKPFPDFESFEKQVRNWTVNRNARCVKTNWQFTTADARIKLAKAISNDTLKTRWITTSPGNSCMLFALYSSIFKCSQSALHLVFRIHRKPSDFPGHGFSTLHGCPLWLSMLTRSTSPSFKAALTSSPPQARKFRKKAFGCSALGHTGKMRIMPSQLCSIISWMASGMVFSCSIP